MSLELKRKRNLSDSYIYSKPEEISDLTRKRIKRICPKVATKKPLKNYPSISSQYNQPWNSSPVIEEDPSTFFASTNEFSCILSSGKFHDYSMLNDPDFLCTSEAEVETLDFEENEINQESLFFEDSVHEDENFTKNIMNETHIYIPNVLNSTHIEGVNNLSSVPKSHHLLHDTLPYNCNMIDYTEISNAADINNINEADREPRKALQIISLNTNQSQKTNYNMDAMNKSILSTHTSSNIINNNYTLGTQYDTFTNYHNLKDSNIQGFQKFSPFQRLQFNSEIKYESQNFENLKSDYHSNINVNNEGILSSSNKKEIEQYIDSSNDSMNDSMKEIVSYLQNQFYLWKGLEEQEDRIRETHSRDETSPKNSRIPISTTYR